MKIAYCATVQPAYGGLRTFNQGLVQAMFERAKSRGDVFLVICPLRDRSAFPDIPDSHIRTFEGNHFWFESAVLPGLLRREQIDFSIFPHNRMPLWGSVPGRSGVIIHDLLFWRFPEQFSSIKRFTRYFFMSQALKKADLVYSVSAFTAAELREFGFKKPIHVCLEGIEPLVETVALPVSGRFPVDKPFFLFIGASSFQKNLPACIQAFEGVRRQGLDCRLVLAGGKGTEAQRVEDLCNQSEFASDIVRPGFITDEEKRYLLSAAQAFVFPSIYEGFGIPILEAYQYGCPVICSDQASLPEVAGDAALVTGPDPVSLREAMVKVLLEPGIREVLRAKGHERWKSFTWERSAELIENQIFI
jgi:glycosyltransferase involved in cell wall biosynthesis